MPTDTFCERQLTAYRVDITNALVLALRVSGNGPAWGDAAEWAELEFMQRLHRWVKPTFAALETKESWFRSTAPAYLRSF